MRIPFLISIFLSGLCWQAQARQVDLSALSPAAKTAILKEVPKLQSNQWTLVDLDEAVKHLISTEQYDAASFFFIENESGGVYKLRLGKTQRISSIRIVGASAFSVNDIRKEFGFVEKNTFDQSRVIDAGEKVRQMYINRGYRNTLIDLAFSKLSDTEIEITMQITENQPTQIQKIYVDIQNPAIAKCLTKEFKDYEKEVLRPEVLNEIRESAKDCFADYSAYRAQLDGPSVTLLNDDKLANLAYRVSDSNLYMVEFTGNNKLTDGELKSSLDLDNFSSSNPNIGAELANKVKEHYLKEGYARAETQYREETDEKSHRKKVTINISEGYKFSIGKIEISGRFSQPEVDYKNFIIEHSSELIQDGFYNRNDFDIGLNQLLIDRRNNGYLQTKIISTRVIFAKDKPVVNVLVNLDEGPLTKLRSVQFIGNKNITAEKLAGTTELVVGDNLRSNILDSAILSVKSYYKDQGYLEMLLENERSDLVQYNADNTLADVVFKIYEGPQVRVAGIIVEGNTLTKDYVILKELDFHVGEILSPAKIEESTRRLQRLGHFNSVDIRTLEERTQVSDRTVVVRVSDRDPGIFTLGFGATNERKLTLRGYTGVAYRNILGTGRGVSARLEGNYNVAEIKYLERKITLGYLEPYIFNTRIRGKVSFTRSTEVSNFNTKRAADVSEQKYSLEQDITSHVLGTYDLWNIATVRDFSIDINSQVPSTELNIASTGPALEIDYRDHPFNPTTGTFTRLSLEYATPGLGSSPTIQYLRSQASFTHYWGIGKTRWVWANSVRTSYLKNFNNSEDGGVPYDRKGLTLGGQTTLRGFESGESFPNNNDFGLPADGPAYLLKSEAILHLVKSEIRFPIYGNFGGAFFYDGGAVLVQGVKFPDPWRDSVGIGARYITPVGAVSFEVGFKLDRRSERGESQFPFHFSIGTF